jgi:O-antigen/teichoic acid export membrane protein
VTNGTDTRRGSLSWAALSTLSTNVAVAGLSFFNVLITARALGAEGRGTLAFVMTIAMLTSQLSSLGVEEASANIAGTRPDRRPMLATNAVVLAGLCGAAAIGLIAVSVAVFPSVGGDASTGLLWLALASIPLLVAQFYFQFLVRADYGFGVANAAALIAPLLNVTANGLLAAFGLISVATAMSTWIIGQLLATLLLAGYIATRLVGFGRPDPGLARESVGFGLKAHAGRVMKTGNYRLDQWLLGSIAGSRELGLYTVAVAWTEALFFLPEALSAVLRPEIVRAQRREAGARIAFVFRIAVLLTAPAVLVLVIAAPFLCVTIFGDEFEASINDLRVLAPGAFGIVALKLLANALVAQRRPLLSTAAVGVAFVLTVVLDLLLIPDHGALGAAIASTAAYTAGGIAAVVLFVRALGISAREIVPRSGDLRELKARGVELGRLVPRRRSV